MYINVIWKCILCNSISELTFKNKCYIKSQDYFPNKIADLPCHNNNYWSAGYFNCIKRSNSWTHNVRFGFSKLIVIPRLQTGNYVMRNPLGIYFIRVLNALWVLQTLQYNLLIIVRSRSVCVLSLYDNLHHRDHFNNDCELWCKSILYGDRHESSFNDKHLPFLTRQKTIQVWPV